MPKNTISWSCSNRMLSFIRNYQVVFLKDCIIPHSHKQHMRTPSSISSPASSVIATFYFCYSDRCVVISSVVLTDIFLVANEYKHLFMCLTSLYLLHRNVCFCLLLLFLMQFVTSFFFFFFFFFTVESWIFLSMWDIRFVNHFFQSATWLFILLIR